jgi:hypothetical protein
MQISIPELDREFKFQKFISRKYGLNKLNIPKGSPLKITQPPLEGLKLTEKKKQIM